MLNIEETMPRLIILNWLNEAKPMTILKLRRASSKPRLMLLFYCVAVFF
jgi:hypothetical protein